VAHKMRHFTSGQCSDSETPELSRFAIARGLLKCQHSEIFGSGGLVETCDSCVVYS